MMQGHACNNLSMAMERESSSALHGIPAAFQRTVPVRSSKKTYPASLLCISSVSEAPSMSPLRTMEESVAFGMNQDQRSHFSGLVTGLTRMV